jgi:hypothetical protein
MGPRSTRQAVAPPSDGTGTAAEGAGGEAEAEAGGDAEGEAAADVVPDTDAATDGDGSGGRPFPGDPLHAVRTAKTSQHGARTPLLYYA